MVGGGLCAVTAGAVGSRAECGLVLATGAGGQWGCGCVCRCANASTPPSCGQELQRAQERDRAERLRKLQEAHERRLAELAHRVSWQAGRVGAAGMRWLRAQGAFAPACSHQFNGPRPLAAGVQAQQQHSAEAAAEAELLQRPLRAPSMAELCECLGSGRHGVLASRAVMCGCDHPSCRRVLLPAGASTEPSVVRIWAPAPSPTAKILHRPVRWRLNAWPLGAAPAGMPRGSSLAPASLPQRLSVLLFTRARLVRHPTPGLARSPVQGLEIEVQGLEAAFPLVRAEILGARPGC